MLWIKAFHIIFMVTWFSGLFYLPRLFVYHAMSNHQETLDRFKQMEHKLYHIIMTPGAVLTTFFGIWLLSYNYHGYLSMPWVQVKLILVAILWLFHVYLGKIRRTFARDENTKSPGFYRCLNEFPTLILISVVLLAILKPS